MNGHDSRCRCDKCAMDQRIKILEERVEILMSAYHRSLSAPLKSVPDPEFDWVRVDEKLEVHVGVSPPRSVPPILPKGCYIATDEDMRNVRQQIEADRDKEEAYFKDRAAGFRTVEIASDESAQPFVIGGEG